MSNGKSNRKSNRKSNGEDTTMQTYRTPDAAFDALPDFPFTPHYLEWNGLCVHHIDEGHADAPVMLLLHGEPT